MVPGMDADAEMLALTLTQPWATFWALGIKVLETRGWATNHRGLLAIHAAKSVPAWALSVDFGPYSIEKDNPRGSEPAYLLRGPTLSWPYRLPLGMMLGTCTVLDVVPTSRCWRLGDPVEGAEILRPEMWPETPPLLAAPALLDVSDQLRFGNFGDDRFAWVLRDRKVFRRPVRASGRQKLWRWKSTEAAA